MRRIVVALGIVLALAACATEATVELAAPEHISGVSLQLGSSPVVSLGDGSGGSPFFHLVEGVLRLSDSRIVVGEMLSADIYVFDQAGAHVDTWGGKGEGPGELARIDWMQKLPGDTIAVYAYADRLTYLSPSGRWVRSSPTPYVRTPRGVLSDGTLIASRPAGSSFPTERLAQQSIELLRMSADYRIIESYGLFLDRWVAYGRDCCGGSVPNGLPQSRFVLGNGRAYVVYGGVYEVTEIVPGDSARVIVRRELDPTYVTDELLQAAGVEFMLNRVGRAEPFWMLDGIEVPRERIPAPVIRNVVADALGNIWVERQPIDLHGPTEWDVFDAAGNLVDEVVMPPRFTPHDIGADYVLGVRLGDLSVEYVELWGLTRTDTTAR